MYPTYWLCDTPSNPSPRIPMVKLSVCRVPEAVLTATVRKIRWVTTRYFCIQKLTESLRVGDQVAKFHGVRRNSTISRLVTIQ